MARYVVPLTSWANIAVEVEVPDDVTDPEAIAELAMEQASPSLCHQCSDSRNDSLEIGDEWSVPRFPKADSVPDVTRLED